MSDCAWCDGARWVGAEKPADWAEFYEPPVKPCPSCLPDWRPPHQRAEVVSPQTVNNRVDKEEKERWH